MIARIFRFTLDELSSWSDIHTTETDVAFIWVTKDQDSKRYRLKSVYTLDKYPAYENIPPNTHQSVLINRYHFAFVSAKSSAWLHMSSLEQTAMTPTDVFMRETEHEGGKGGADLFSPYLEKHLSHKFIKTHVF